MVRRIIDADNSCLFNAVGYALRRKRKVGSELRQMITEAVRGSPEVYNEVRTRCFLPGAAAAVARRSVFVSAAPRRSCSASSCRTMAEDQTCVHNIVQQPHNNRSYFVQYLWEFAAVA